MGGCQADGDGSFPRTEREVYSGTKIHLFEFGVKYLNFGATYLSFGAIFLSFGAMHLSFGNRVFLKGVGGGWVDPPRPPRDFVIGVGKKHSTHPLALSQPRQLDKAPPLHLC